MILPQTSTFVLAVAVLSLLLLGSWASLFKAAGKWRYELFYFDFAFGVLIAMLVCSFTFGDLGFDGFNFLDDIAKAGKRQWMFAILAGGVFNLGNMLLMAAVSVAGISVAFPIAFGMAILLGAGLGNLVKPGDNATMVMLGCLLIFAAATVSALAYRINAVLRHEEQARAGRAKSTRRPSAIKGIILAVAAGLLMGSVGNLVNLARSGELGMGPYATSGFLALGVFFSTFVYNVFLMNLPVDGDPIDFGAYFAGTRMQHALGVAGGILWFCGALAAMVLTAVPAGIQLDARIGTPLSQGSALLAAIIGLVFLREAKAGDMRVKVLSALMLVLFACGILMLGLAAAPVKG
ncbi:MAG: hypothetical protein KGN36_01400 [Acidobacteriota bacterium]|nr:hypothetical protein [Acidobacteriota bacterium]